MSFSIQTNVSSLIAQENLRVNNEFQSRTIGRLTSGYRINSSGDDAAGLAIANKYRSDIAELVQGVRNANDGISALQIVDGGLNNISKILDRLKTLATQSASTTFTGNRTTLNNEYQDLLQEITRQANNIELVDGGRYNSRIMVYIGGGNSQVNAQVTVDLSSASDRVDANSLGVGSTSVAGGGSGLTGNLVDTLNDSGATFLANAAGQQAFTFRIYDSHLGTTGTVTATVNGNASGISATEALRQLNATLSQYGITASSNADGYLVFGGTRAFSVSVGAVGGGGNALATATAAAENQGVYRYTVDAFTANTNAQTLTFQNAGGSVNVSLGAGTNLADTIAAINAQTASMGIYAIEDGNSGGISIQSASDFSLTGTASGGADGIFNNATATSAAVSDPDTSATATGAAQAAIVAISSAVGYLGLVQGKVGTGQNKLQYSIQLAQSQISNFSAAESRIRDADVAAEAANLTKAQVLQQASLAAMAQANSAPQAVLSLLRG